MSGGEERWQGFGGGGLENSSFFLDKDQSVQREIGSLERKGGAAVSSNFRRSSNHSGKILAEESTLQTQSHSIRKEGRHQAHFPKFWLGESNK